MNCNIFKDIIYDLSCQFRTAMNSAYEDGVFDNEVELQRFPSGSCGISSCFLGEYLMEHGITTKLEINPHLIIDITGDQFKNNPILMNYDVPVYVGDYNEFYNLFESTPNGEHKLIKDHILSNEERIIYNKIKEYL